MESTQTCQVCGCQLVDSLDPNSEAPRNTEIPIGEHEKRWICTNCNLQQPDSPALESVATKEEEIIESASLELETDDSAESQTAQDQDEDTTEDLGETSNDLTDSAAVAPWKMDPLPRNRFRRDQTPLWRKILPPVVGGLAAFPIAVAILWYGFGRDIGSTGPTVAKYVPWIVPSHLRGPSNRATSSHARDNSKTLNPQRSRRSTAKVDTDFGTTNDFELPSVNKNETRTSSPKYPPTQIRASQDADLATKDLNTAPNPNEPSSVIGKTESPPTQSIRTTLDRIDSLQRSMESNWQSLPKDEQLELIRQFYQTHQLLADQIWNSSTMNLRPWKQDLESLFKSILHSTSYPKIIVLCNQGKIPYLPKLDVEQYVLTIESLVIDSNAQTPQAHTIELSPNQKIEAIIPVDILKQLPSSEAAQRLLLLGKLEPSEPGTLKLSVVYAYSE